MKVVHISSMDFGGAGKAAFRLHKGLQSIGVDSRMVVMCKQTSDDSVYELPSEVSGRPEKWWDLLISAWNAALADYPLRSPDSELFSLFSSAIPIAPLETALCNADIINLHWVAGLFDMSFMPKVLEGKKIVWTLHDMNPFTGGCHYAGECVRYRDACGACPQLASSSDSDLSRSGWLRKSAAYRELDPTVVTPSRWLKGCSSNSALLRRFRHEVIPYGFPIDTFKPIDRQSVRAALKIPTGAKVALFCADSVFSKRKGFRYLLESLELLSKSGRSGNIVLAVIGNYDSEAQKACGYPVLSFGHIGDEGQMALLYNAADLFVLPSLEDNFPNTVVESLACGTPVVAFNIGGVPDMVEQSKTGYLAPAKDIKGLAEAIEWCVHRSPQDIRLSCRCKAEKSFSLAIQARNYVNLYDSLCPGGARASKRPMMKKSQAKISIVTPSYNQAEYLEECIDSVLSQNYPNLEYVIMDGGSTDGSVDIIKKYEKRLTYWKSQPDGGQYIGVNEGFRSCTGEIMAWLNSDDKYHPGALWLVSDTFRTFPQVEWVMGSPTGWDENGKALYFSAQPPLWSREKYLRGEIGPPHIQQESTFWRRNLWQKAGGSLDTNFVFAADMELWARFFRYTQLHTLHAPIAGFRRQPNQKTAHFIDRYNHEAEQVVERERILFQSSSVTSLQPAPPPLYVEEVVSQARSSITPSNFGFFSYSRTIHFPFFGRNDLELYGNTIDPYSCDLKAYQDLLVYTFIKQNIPAKSRILEIGGGNSRILRALRNDYECWNLDKLEGVGNGPTKINAEGFMLVRDYIGSFSPELPNGYFDLAFSISALEHVEETEENFRNICDDMARILKPDGWSLHCFDIVAKKLSTWTNGLLPYIFQHVRTANKFAPFEQIYLDPFAYAMSEKSYNRYWRAVTKIPYHEHGFPISYNVLWSNKDSGTLNVPVALSSANEEGYLVSAIVSTYNAEKFFRGCLQNLVDQTLYRKGQLQIVIINSGSEQDEESIAREFMDRHEHIIYKRTNRETLYAAWNRGIELARGRYITHANTDDRHWPNAFELMAQKLEQNEVGLVYVDALMTRGVNETFKHHSAEKAWLLPDFNIRQAIFDCPFGCQVMWRRSVHADVGMFDGSYKRAGDYEFFLRLALKSGALHLPKILALYHESPSNLSYEAPEEVIQEVNRFIGTYRRQLPLESIYPYLKKDSSPAAQAAALVDFANNLMGSNGFLFKDTLLAESLYRQALEILPRDPDIIGNLIIACLVNGTRIDAISLIQSASRLTPRLAYCRDALVSDKAPMFTLTRMDYHSLSAMQAIKTARDIRVPWDRSMVGNFKKPIMIDGVIFQLQHGSPFGISRLWRSLLSEMAGTPLAERIVILDRAGTAPEIPGLRRRRVAAFRLGNACNEAAALDDICNEEEAVLFVSTYYTYTKTTASLLMLYDLIPERFDTVGPDAPNPEWRDKYHAIVNASSFAAISQSTARDLEKFYPQAASRPQKVIPCAVSDAFRAHSTDEIAAFKAARGLSKRYFLLVGRRDAHKNVRLFFQAFAQLPDCEQYAIVMAGAGHELEPDLRELIAGADSYAGFFSDHDLALLYSGALALVYPSIYEGFGLPILEAMQSGCPVITCHNSSIFEVAGRAALYVGECDVDGLSKTLLDVQQPDVRGYLIKAGLEQAQRFSWKKSAALLSATINAQL